MHKCNESIIPQLQWTAWTANSLFFNSTIMKIASITIVSVVILATCKGMTLWLTSVLFVLCLLYYWTLCKYPLDGLLFLWTTRPVDFFPVRKPNFQFVRWYLFVIADADFYNCRYWLSRFRALHEVKCEEIVHLCRITN